MFGVATRQKDYGLVDEIGGLSQTVKAIAKDNGIENYVVESYPNYESSIDEILERFGISSAKVKENIVKEEIGEPTYEILQKIKHLSTQKGVQARLPFELAIQ